MNIRNFEIIFENSKTGIYLDIHHVNIDIITIRKKINNNFTVSSQNCLLSSFISFPIHCDNDKEKNIST